eukprot:1700192-Alexandrium_andersonii.AAC.1
MEHFHRRMGGWARSRGKFIHLECVQVCCGGSVAGRTAAHSVSEGTVCCMSLHGSSSLSPSGAHSLLSARLEI